MIKITLLALFCAILMSGQTPGTVIATTTNTTIVIGTASTVVCRLTNFTPQPSSGVHVECLVNGVQVMVMDSVVPALTSGLVGSFSNTGNIVTWIVTKPIAVGPYAWQMVANGTMSSGTF